MDRLPHQPVSFIETITEKYVGPHKSLCKEADEIWKMAFETLYNHGVKERTSKRKKVLSSRDAVIQVDDESTRFRIVTERTGLYVSRKRLGASVISLIVNENYFDPAAIIFPPQNELQSASVIVDGVANDQRHLQEILPVMRKIEVASLPTVYRDA